jgi:hypothetical protein
MVRISHFYSVVLPYSYENEKPTISLVVGYFEF